MAVTKRSGKYQVERAGKVHSFATEAEAHRFDTGPDVVNRIDVGELKPPVKLPNGFLRADAYFTRTGVFPYRDVSAAGGLRREYRPPSEVFHADSLASLQLVPVTDDHPPVMLHADNATEYQRGTVGEALRRDGDKIAGTIMVTDAGLVDKLDTGEAREVSLGYSCELERVSGRTDAGEPYDAIQRNIRYNHAAVLPRGRAGSDVRVRMDAANLAVILDQEPAAEKAAPSRGANVFKTRIDGVEVQFENEAAHQLFLRNRKDADDKAAADLAAARKDATEHKARADGLQAKFDTAEATVTQLKKDAAELPTKLKAEATARFALEQKAVKVLGTKQKLDGLSDKEVRAKVLAKLVPDLKLDGRPDAYVEARFDSELERFDAADDREDGFPPKDDEEDDDKSKKKDGDDAGDDREDGDDVRLDADEARKALIKHSANRWKKPTSGGATLEGDRIKMTR